MGLGQQYSFNRHISIIFNTTGTVIVHHRSSNIISLTLVLPLKLPFSKNLALLDSIILVFEKENKSCNLLICLNNLQTNNPLICDLLFYLRIIYFDFCRKTPNMKVIQARFPATPQLKRYLQEQFYSNCVYNIGCCFRAYPKEILVNDMYSSCFLPCP